MNRAVALHVGFVGYLSAYTIDKTLPHESEPPGVGPYRKDVIAFHLEGAQGQAIPQDVIQGMETIGRVLADGQVTAEELGEVLELTTPHLADHPEFATVLKVADEAIRSVRDDGKVSMGEGLAIAIPLLTHGAQALHLAEYAKTLVAGILKPLSWLRGEPKIDALNQAREKAVETPFTPEAVVESVATLPAAQDAVSDVVSGAQETAAPVVETLEKVAEKLPVPLDDNKLMSFGLTGGKKKPKN